jgi:hypothetical protein
MAGTIIGMGRIPRAAVAPLCPPRPRNQQQQRKNRTRVAPLRTTVSARRHYFPRPKIKQRTAGTRREARLRHYGCFPLKLFNFLILDLVLDLI